MVWHGETRGPAVVRDNRKTGQQQHVVGYITDHDVLLNQTPPPLRLIRGIGTTGEDREKESEGETQRDRSLEREREADTGRAAGDGDSNRRRRRRRTPPLPLRRLYCTCPAVTVATQRAVRGQGGPAPRRRGGPRHIRHRHISW